MNNLMNDLNLVRDGNQPPAFPSPSAALGCHESSFFLARPACIQTAALTVLAVSLLVWAAAGCQTPVAVQGAYGTANREISGGFASTSNSVTVNGLYQHGATNIGGAVQVGK